MNVSENQKKNLRTRKVSSIICHHDFLTDGLLENYQPIVKISERSESELSENTLMQIMPPKNKFVSFPIRNAFLEKIELKFEEFTFKVKIYPLYKFLKSEIIQQYIEMVRQSEEEFWYVTTTREHKGDFENDSKKSELSYLKDYSNSKEIQEDTKTLSEPTQSLEHFEKLNISDFEKKKNEPGAVEAD